MTMITAHYVALRATSSSVASKLTYIHTPNTATSRMAVCCASPGHMLIEVISQLGDGEDEHQVKEELHRGDVAMTLVNIRGAGRHDRPAFPYTHERRKPEITTSAPRRSQLGVPLRELPLLAACTPRAGRGQAGAAFFSMVGAPPRPPPAKSRGRSTRCLRSYRPMPRGAAISTSHSSTAPRTGRIDLRPRPRRWCQARGISDRTLRDEDGRLAE